MIANEMKIENMKEMTVLIYFILGYSQPSIDQISKYIYAEILLQISSNDEDFGPLTS